MRRKLITSLLRATPKFLIILAITLFFAGSPDLCGASALAGQKPNVYLKFNQSPAQEVRADVPVKIQGGNLIAQGLSGKAWRLNQGDYFELDLQDKLSPEEGAIMFWVRPHWDNTSAPSHTLVSFAWSGPGRPYGVISRGWWEPAGAQRTYFILNNQDHAHVSKAIDYEKGWTHLACTWKAGNPGFLRLYVNGFRAAAGKYTSKMKRQLASPVFIGSDQGSPLAKSRWAEADLDELALFPRALSDEEIFQIFFEQRPPAQRPPKMVDGKLLETRAIFDEGIGWATEAGAQKTIERIKRAGFNVYIPCVWHGRGTRYPSPKAPPEPGFTIITTDPLKRLIDIAHQHGIEVHPWFCVALRQRDFLPEYYGPGTPEKAFDLHRPSFRTFITEVIADVIRRYDVDGVDLDYIRTMGLCKCDFCQKEYHSTTGRYLLEDIASLQPGKSLPPALQKWQDEAVEDIVHRVKEKGQALKPGLIVSVCGYPQLSSSQEGREEISWANAGPLTVTHPEIERFFMTIPEAVQLVLQAAVMGQGGDIFVLNMGRSVKIKELAEKLILLAGKTPGNGIEIVYTGLRPGEKLFEELFNQDEKPRPTEHPLINRAVGNQVSPEKWDILLDEIDMMVRKRDSSRLLEKYKMIIPNYSPPISS